jgi:ABC-type multidrug transport system fused ATPase/permease subunit
MLSETEARLQRRSRMREILASHASTITALAFVRVAMWLAVPAAIAHASQRFAALASLAIGGVAAACESLVTVRARPALRRSLLESTARQALHASMARDDDRLGQLVASAYEAESAVLSTVPAVIAGLSALAVTLAMTVSRFGAPRVAPWIAALFAALMLRRCTRDATGRTIDAEVARNNEMVSLVQLCLRAEGELGRGAPARHLVARTGAAADGWARAEIRREMAYRVRRFALIGTFGLVGLAISFALGAHPSVAGLRSIATPDVAWALMLFPIALSLAHALDLYSHSSRAVEMALCDDGTASESNTQRLPQNGGIRARDLVVRYGQTVALDRVSFDVPSRGVTVVVGPNAAGKSTLARAIAGILEPSEGALTIGSIAPSSIAPDDIAYVPQHPAWLSGETVFENVRLAEPTLERTAVATAFDRLGLAIDLDRRVSELSTGQRRRVAVARAILRDSPLLVLDEADAGLDRDARAWLADVVRQTAESRTVVVVTHHPALFAFADAVIVLDERHRVVDAGSPAVLRERCVAYASLVRADETFGSAGVEPDELALRGTG